MKFGRNEHTLPQYGTKWRVACFGAVFGMNVIHANKTEEPEQSAAPDPKAVEAIGRALEAHYADLVKAPLPGKFVELLAQLEAQDRVSDAQGRRDALG